MNAPLAAPPAPNLHLLPPETLDAIMTYVPSNWDLLSLALTAKLLSGPALARLWREIHVFGPSPRVERALASIPDESGERQSDDSLDSSSIPYYSFVRSVVSGWFALDSPSLSSLLAAVGPTLQKLDLWRLRIRAEHMHQQLDLAIARCLGEKLTTLDISDWNTGAWNSALEKSTHLKLQTRPDAFIRAVASSCPNLKRLYCHETDIDPAVLVEAVPCWPRLEELWIGHTNWAVERTTTVNTSPRYPVISQQLIDRLARAVSESLVELGLFQLSINGKTCNVLRPFLEHCSKLKRLVFKRCDARHLFEELANSALPSSNARQPAAAPLIESLRLKLAAKTELEPFLRVLPALHSLSFLHLTLYLDFRDPGSERTHVARLAETLGLFRLDSLSTLRLSLEVSYSTTLNEEDRDVLMADLLGNIDIAFPNVTWLDFKYSNYIDSHSQRILWGRRMIARLAQMGKAKVERGSPLCRISMSGRHLESLDAFAATLRDFGNRLSTIVLRDVNKSLFDELKTRFGYDSRERLNEPAETDHRVSWIEREAMVWRNWAGQVHFWANQGWGIHDSVDGQTGADAAEAESFETLFVKLDSLVAIRHVLDVLS